MRRLLLVILVALVLAGGALLLGAASTPSRIYAVRQFVQELRRHPHAWTGRTVHVRAIVMTDSWGSGHGLAAGHQTFLVDPPFADNFIAIPYGSRTMQLNMAGLAPTLLLTSGSMPPLTLAQHIALLLGYLPGLGPRLESRFFSPAGTYRVQILGAGPCPAAFSGFCPIATVAS